MICEELEGVLARPRYGRRQQTVAEDDEAETVIGHRHGSRERPWPAFGKTRIKVPRESGAAGRHDERAAEWNLQSLGARWRLTL
jgi:hypothetical protein